MMNNNQTDEVAANASVPKWRTLVRQQSERISTLAEEVVLPKNERFSQRTNDLSLENIEAQRSIAALYNNRMDHEKHFPVFMVTISLIQIMLFYSIDQGTLLLLFGYDPHRRHEVWRFITIMMVHRSGSHLWNNVIMQLICGITLEFVHRWKRIGTIYFASVFGGSLFISVLDNIRYTVGASAGVYGLLFSQLATITLNWNEMEKKCCALITLLIYIFIDVGLSLYDEFVTHKNTGISHIGHLGGALTGFLVSILVLKNFRIQQWERKMQKICIGILIAICGIIFVVNIAVPGHYLPVEWNFQYSHTFLKDFIEAVNKSEILTKRCVQEKYKCKWLLDQYNFNGTIST